LNFALTSISGLLFGIAFVLLATAVYEIWLAPFFADVHVHVSRGISFSTAAIRQLGSLNRRLMPAGYQRRVSKNLSKAGRPRELQPQDIIALQEIGFVLGSLFGTWLSWSMNRAPWASIAFGFLGAAYPLIWLRDQVKRRHVKILRALPYNLDLITLSVEAGLDFASALGKVVEKGKAGPLREELQLVLKELKMGISREQALKSLIARVDLPALTTLINSLIQANKMGTSLGKVLRIQSTQLRIDRTHRAEKLASEAPVKMLFPLLAFIFPTILMILFAPVVFAVAGKLM
jgi:tight adherence protein C